ncbi:hypothetical protein EYB53_001265 [Candidatus Chloroploca sp. M-50]|uniref:Glycosyltransferase RgtA/B/C/D-like domain-containing protein n=1 Tax=Candidatus Chloroploca mongolica TaxID=2528176 RepID=A0ABS4D4G1_9CHLR|nr:hypothetical protein [Candidatus Chloroploca mongolica]MBP1464326.1 hypothetical protein [Candidatus Chloroploca mongolica]
MSLLYVVIAIGMTWPLALHLDSALTENADTLQQTWILAWNAYALAHDPLQVWHAPIFYPYPSTAAYHDHHLILSLLAAPVIWLSNNPVLAHNLLVLLSFVVAGWGGYTLSRALGAQPGAAFVGGLIFAFSTYRFAHIMQLNLLQSGWMALAMAALVRFLQPEQEGGGSWRDALRVGFWSGLQAANAFYYGFFLAPLILGYVGFWVLTVLWARVRTGTAFPWMYLGRLSAGGVLALLVCVPFLLPYLEIYRTLGIVRTIRELDHWSAPLSAFFAVLPENWLYGRTKLLPQAPHELALFAGFVTLGLAMLSPVIVPRSWRTRFWWLTFAVAILLSFGTGLRWERGDPPLPVPTPYPLLYQVIPGFGAMRVPSRWGLIALLALAPLAALSLSRLIERRPSWQQLGLVTLCSALILGEHGVAPLTLREQALGRLDPLYATLGTPAYADVQVMIELPVGALARGDDLQRTTERHFASLLHWKKLPIAYGALIPFGTLDLLRSLQSLPNPQIVDYLRLLGVDTLVIHADQYNPEAFAALTGGFEAQPEVTMRGQIGAALLYRLTPDPRRSLPLDATRPPPHVLISNDERMPGLAVLSLSRAWQEAGSTIYGPGRIRYYGSFAPLPVGMIPSYALLASAEDPERYGYRVANQVWSAHGLTLYAADPTLVANLELGVVASGMFHPTYPNQVTIKVEEGRIQLGKVTVPRRAAEPMMVELDIAAQRAGELTGGNASLRYASGLSRLRLPLTAGLTALHLAPDAVFLRVRLLHDQQPATVQSIPGRALTSTGAFVGSSLIIEKTASGTATLGLRIRGAAAYDDRPIRLVEGALPVKDARVRFEVDLLNPQGAWLTERGKPEDGRYIAYLVNPDDPDDQGLPVAQFQLVAGVLQDAQIVVLPLTGVVER